MADPVGPDAVELRRLAEAACFDDEPTLADTYALGALHDALPPEVVLGLLDRLEAAEARVEEIDEEREDWETSHRDLAEQHMALSEFARSMASAIGWDETPGDSWVEKALNWRQDPESLPGLYAELNRLRPVARALAAISGDGVLTEADDACSLCSEGPGDFDHDPRCPWVLAKDWAAEKADPVAPAGEPEAEGEPEVCGHEWTTREPQECNRPAHQDGHHGPDCSATVGHTCGRKAGHDRLHWCGHQGCYTGTPVEPEAEGKQR